MVILLFALQGLVCAHAADLSVAYSQSSDQAIIVSFFNRQMVGNNLQGTLQIENISGTWVYIEQDLTSSANPVLMPYTIYLLGPGAIKQFPNFSFPSGSYLELHTTTPLGLDYASQSEKTIALEGAFTVDILTRGLLTFALPSNAFDQPPAGQVIEPMLDTIVENVSGVEALFIAVRDLDYGGIASAVVQMAGDSQHLEGTLANLVANDVTADQVHNALGIIGEMLNLGEKASLLTDLTAETFSAPPSSWARLDVVAKTQAPTITSVSPGTLTTLPLPQTQTLTIHGTGFFSASHLVFTVGSETYASRTDRLSCIDSNTLSYNIAVGSAAGTWTVKLADGTGSATFQVQAVSSGSYNITPLAGPHGSISPSVTLAKAGGESETLIAAPQDSTYSVDSWYVDGTVIPNAGNRLTLANIQGPHSVYVTFKLTAATPQTGSLTVTLSPAGAVSAGAQWRVDSGTWRNSGDTASGLTTGSHSVSFKATSGYTAPSDHTVTINSGAVTSDTGPYTVVAPNTYTLTLNQGGDTGSITPSPLGSWIDGFRVYTAGSVVQLTASANPGYHFGGWAGDASGTANPTTVTMTGNKSVSASFVSGDPNMGTVCVTIQPPAAAAGVTWGFNSADFRASGSSYSTWPATYLLTIHPVDGWLGPSVAGATIVAGQTTNVTVTYMQDTTPGMLTVTLSPPDAVTAGAKWHVNGGAAQGSGSTVSLAAGSGYTVTYDSVSGWTAPASQVVTVQRAQTTVATGNYTPPAGKPAIISLFPPVGAMNGGTLMTINGVNFAAPATVLIGGNPASNVTVSSATQITCLTPSSSVYGSTNVIVQIATGSATNVNGFAYGFPRGSGFDLVNSFGGRAYGLAVSGNYAYVGEGRNLLVMNVTSPSSPSKVGRVQLPGTVSGVALFGQYAYVADGEGGMQVVDITTPSAPVIRGFYPTTGLATSVAILGGRAYVGDSAGLNILDLGNPTSPVLISSTTCDAPQDLAMRTSTNGVFAFIGTFGQIRVLDVSNPNSPVFRGAISVGGASMAISGNRLFAAAWSNLHMIDISNPDALVDLATASGITIASEVSVANGLLYAVSVVSYEGFRVYSVSGNSLSAVGNVTGVSASGNHMIASGNVVYIAGGTYGLEVVNVANSASPSLLTSFNDSGFFDYYYQAALYSHYLYVAGEGGLKVVDVNTPTAPSLTWLNAGLFMYENGRIIANSGYAYLASGNVPIMNLANPASPVLLTNAVPANTIITFDGALVGNYLILAGAATSTSTGKLVTVDVSTPSSPVLRGVLPIPFQGDNDYAISVAVNGSKAIVGMRGGRVKVVDLSNMNLPIERGQVSSLGRPVGLAISGDGQYAYAIDGDSSNLRILNISSATSPFLVTSVALDSAGGRRVEMRGTDLYVATFQALYVFDTSTPASPVLKRTFTAANMQSIALPGQGSTVGQICLADSDGGILVLSEKDIQAPNVYITNPTFSSVYTNATSTVGLGGGSDDDVGVTRITWSSNRGGGGDVTAPLDNWYAGGIKLVLGTNILTVDAFDAAGNVGRDALTVIYQPPMQNQTITFPAIANHTFGEAPVALAAAASSGLPVTFNVVSGVASLSSNVLTLAGAGTVTVQANQAGNSSFNAAPSTNVSFNVAKADQSVTFAVLPDRAADSPPFSLSATSSSGLPVTFNVVSGPASLATNVVTLLGAGTVIVSASQPGNSNYNAATTVQRSFNVTAIPQTISFGPLSRQTLGDAPFPVSATADSGLPVGLSIVSGPAVLDGNIVTVTNIGMVVMRAAQPGNASYAPAASVDQSLVVAPGNNLITDAGRLPTGHFTLTFAGEFDRPYVVECSTNADLTGWMPLATNVVDGLGNLEFVDPVVTNRMQGFYRVKVQ